MTAQFEVEIRPRAERDLLGLYDYISEQSGHRIAEGYIERIEAACLQLETFPMRGAARDDIRPGLRTMGFERRATIAFVVATPKVTVVRIFYGGQDFEAHLRKLNEF